MKRIMKNFLLFSFVILFTTILLADPIDVDLTGTPYYNNFPASSIDPTHPDAQPEIFSLSITNNSGNEILAESLDAYFSFSLDGGLLIEANLTPDFDLVIGEQKVISSNDIITNEGSIYFNSDIDYDQIISDNEDLKDSIMETGKFPDGVYSFYFRIIFDGNNYEDNFNITVNSPGATTLIYPGNSVGGSITSIMTSTPDFTWSSNQNNFALSIYQFTEDVDDISSLTSARPFFQIDGIASPYQYPQMAPSLEPGYVYAWKIRTSLDSPAGSSYLNSEYFLFNIGSTEDMTDLNSQLLSTAFDILGLGDNQVLQNLINQGYSPSGTFSINGEQHSFDELITIITQLQNEGKSVANITVE